MKTKTNACFEEQVDSWVGEAVAKGARSFDQIVCALPGVYPTVVAASVVRLQLQQCIEQAFGKRIRGLSRNETPNTVTRLPDKYQLPTPHPLDFDWRFSEVTANNVTRICETLGSRLLCLGTPSIFVRARSSCFESAQLVDNNVEMVRHLKLKYSGVVQHDISRSAFPKIIPADVVAIDPPWYLQDLMGFIWFASKICMNSGYLVVCLPAKGTRPKVNDELRVLLRKAKDYGFSMYLEKPNLLRYQTPHFERNALNAAGIEVRSDWRKGSLWILRKEHDHNLPQPIRESTNIDEWSESTIFGTRFRFKKQARFGFGDPTLKSIIDGDILQSVSRRNRMREFVEVWTSGNRVYACEGTEVLRQIATAIQSKQNVACFVQNQLGVSLNTRQLMLVENATSQIKRIAHLESKERGLLVDLAKDRFDACTNN